MVRHYEKENTISVRVVSDYEFERGLINVIIKIRGKLGETSADGLVTFWL